MFGEIWRRLWYRLNRRRFERALDQEIAAHRERIGEPRRFGNTLVLREQSRDAWGWGGLDRLTQDVRDALRVLRRAPAFAATIVLVLALGIGLNLTFFQLLNVTSIRSLPIRDPGSLVRFVHRGPKFVTTSVAYPAIDVIRESNSVLDAILLRRPGEIVWENEVEGHVPALFVSANWFTALGFDRAQVGRLFNAQDADAAAPPVIVISDSLWRTRFGADSGVAGRAVRINGRPAAIAGVAPRTFPDVDLDNPRLWLLIDQVEYFEPGAAMKTDWNGRDVQLYARLRPGVSPSAAQAGLRPAIEALASRAPRYFNADQTFEPLLAENHFRSASEAGNVMAAAMLLGLLTLLVLGVASANLSNVVLSRAIGRLRELSVRAAIGASRWRILRHIVAECALLAIIGTIAGLAVGSAGARVMAAVLQLPPYLDFTPDWRVFTAGLAAASVAMAVFGMIPAWIVSRRDLIHALRDGGQQVSAGMARARLRHALVGVQVLGCCAVLIVAGAVTRRLQQQLVADPGFAADRVVVLDGGLERYGMNDDQARAYWTTVADAVGADPAVEAASLAAPAPLGVAKTTLTYSEDTGSFRIGALHVDAPFLPLLKVPLVAGRYFDRRDDRRAVIISRSVAMAMYGTTDAIGRDYPRTHPRRTVIGVVDDAALVEIRGHHGQEYSLLEPRDYASASLVVQGRAGSGALDAMLRRAAAAGDPRVLASTWSLAGAYDRLLQPARITSSIAGAMATLVLTLACLGVFGVVSYGVKVRTKEIGIRRALGASAGGVVAVLLRQLLWPVGVAAVVGTTAGVLLSRVLSGDPFYLAVSDATASAAAIAVFVVAVLFAAIVPAIRALRMDPVRALRHE